MQTVPIPFAGGSYKSLSLPYSAQTTKNLFFEVRQGGRSVAALHGTPGMTLFASTNGQHDRGMFIHAGTLYKVSGTQLYSISAGGTSTLIGSIAGTNQTVMASDGTNLIITTGSTPYYYNGTLTAITDSDIGTPNTVAFNNSRVLFDGDDGQFVAADLGQPYQADSLNIATAESAPDDTIALAVHKQYLELFGTGTVEPWFNSGTGSPPYDRVNGGVQEVGLAAIHSVAKDENYLYFLDSKLNPRRLSGITLQNIGNPGLANEFHTYSTCADAKGFCFTAQNDNFYVLTFPTANRTWMFQESIGEWVQLTSGVNNARHRANSYVYCYGKHLIADWENGNVYEWDFSTYSDAGDVILRERTTQPLHAELISGNLAAKTVFMSRLELVLEAGVGLATGQGLTPQVMMQFSDDGGATWSSELWETCGVMGARQWRVQWYQLGNFETRVFRFRMTDPVKCAWFSCNADIEVGV